MTAASRVLAEFAVNLGYDDIPPAARERAVHCLLDAIACARFGLELPWTRLVLDQVLATSAKGPCTLPILLEQGLAIPPAALVLGTAAHAFELDSLRKPGAGVHPGATVALPALAAAAAVGASGRRLIEAIVAGCEVMFRIGSATLHSAERKGFHAPGLTGPFGAATAVGLLLGLDREQLVNAFGIAGSMAGGLLAFSKAGQGGMVKRLHLGRAAESGAVAAELAQRGYEGPDTVLEGRFGLLEAYCPEFDPARLTASLGTAFEIETLCLKRYACHVTAQAPVQFLGEKMAEAGFDGKDIDRMVVSVSPKVISHHGAVDPSDLMQAQYSVPFALAMAAFCEMDDPRSFSEDAVRNPKIRKLAAAVELKEGGPGGWGCSLRIDLKDGRCVEGVAETFYGSPERPMSEAALWQKLTRLGPVGAAAKPWMESLRELRELDGIEDTARLLRRNG